MACGRCGGGARQPAAKAKPVKQAPVKFVPPPGSVQGPGSPEFCPLCGWAIKKVKYADQSGNMIDKKVCTNRRCSNYN